MSTTFDSTVSSSSSTPVSALHPNPATAQPDEFNTLTVEDLLTLEPSMLESATRVYQLAFKAPPYCESFEDKEVHSIFERLSTEGDLLFGTLGDRVIALTGGYVLSDGKTYYIDELAVVPCEQKKGYGKHTFKALLDVVNTNYPEISRKELRTSVQEGTNAQALGLYTTNGFTLQIGPQIVAHERQGGQIGLDMRATYSNPAITNEERLKMLKHAAIVSSSGNVTAVIYDQLLELDRADLNAKIIDAWAKKDSTQPSVEQCCFITFPKNPDAIARVEMFGGEFCANATRAALWLLTKGKDHKGKIEVSGVSHLLKFIVKDKEVALKIPLPAGEDNTSSPWTSGKIKVLHDGEMSMK